MAGILFAMQGTTVPSKPLLDPSLLHRPEAMIPLCIGAFAVLILLCTAYLRYSHRRRLRGYRTLSPLELEEMLQGPPPIVVDVRSRNAPKPAAHIKGTIYIPRAELKDHLADLSVRDANNRVRTVVLVEEGDDVAQKAARFLMDQKLPFVYILYGGLEAWRKKGLPLVK